MNKPPTPPPVGSSLTDDQLAAALPLLDAGTSVRALAAALGCSKHLAAVLINAGKGIEPKPRTKKPKPSAITGPAPAPPMPVWAGVTQALAPREPEPEPAPFEDLKRTRQALKGQLDAAVRRNDREATSSYSLALSRLGKTDDPGELDDADTAEPNLALLPDGAFDFVRFACRVVTPRSDGGGLDAGDQMKAAFYFEGFQALEAMFHAQKPVPGMPIALTFCTPDALVLRSGNERERPGTVQARIQDAREAH